MSRTTAFSPVPKPLFVRAPLPACVAALAFVLAAPSDAATSTARAVAAKPAVHRVYPARLWAYVGHRHPRGHGAVVGYQSGAIMEPGYVYVPGRGILDESCNLPTSACPNSERDIQ